MTRVGPRIVLSVMIVSVRQQEGARERRNAQPWMKGKAKRDVEWHPGQVEESGGAAACKKAAHLIEVAERLQPLSPIARPQRQPDDRIENATTEKLVEAGADPSKDARPDHVEQALDGVEHGQQKDQRDQRRHAAARQDTIVNLQHEERAGKHQHVDDAAEAGDSDKCPAVGDQCFAELGARSVGTRNFRR